MAQYLGDGLPVYLEPSACRTGTGSQGLARIRQGLHAYRAVGAVHGLPSHLPLLAALT
jgi:hypothetical protein